MSGYIADPHQLVSISTFPTFFPMGIGCSKRPSLRHLTFFSLDLRNFDGKKCDQTFTQKRTCYENKQTNNITTKTTTTTTTTTTTKKKQTNKKKKQNKTKQNKLTNPGKQSTDRPLLNFLVKRLRVYNKPY